MKKTVTKLFFLYAGMATKILPLSKVISKELIPFG
jgi:UTP-glucose-1-phosphate uridylyltransferase